MKYLTASITKYYIALLGLIFLFSINGFGQEEQNELNLINEQVWSQFYEAFATSNYELMYEIHHKDLIRISGNGKSISNKETYIERQKESFEKAKNSGENREIELRFFERFYNENTASERGIYQLIVNKGKEDEQIYYGQFHVLHKKELGVWQILMDYDTNENQTISKADFDAARHINEVGEW